MECPYCDRGGGTLIWLKATPAFMLQRKRPCQTQAENNGGQPRGNKTICMQLFAVSRTTKANQRNLNGGWQASTNAFALCLHEATPLCLPSVFFVLFCFLGEWSNIPPVFFFPLPPSDVLMQRSFRGLKVWHDRGLCLWTPNGNILTPKPPLSFHFVSRGFKSWRVSLWCWRQIRRSAPQCHFQFQGVDRKQNMYHDVGGLSPVNYKLSTGEGGVKKKKEKGKTKRNVADWEADPVHALLSWAQ